MQEPGRKFTLNNSYRFGFNGKENDNEVKGEGNQQDYGMRIYDPRLGRFFSKDPISIKYPQLTPYQFASDNPIQNIDVDGLEGISFDLSNLWPRTSAIIVNKIKNYFQSSHQQGIENVKLANAARNQAISQGRLDGDGITSWTKAMVYLGAFWYGGGVNKVLNPIENAKDAKKDFQNGNYVLGTLGVISLIPGLGEIKGLKYLSVESKALIKSVGRFEHASTEVAIITKSGLYSDAVKIGQDLTGEIPRDAGIIFGKQGMIKNQMVGYEWRSSDGVFKRIRLDHDLKVGGHVNVTVGKQDYSILITGENRTRQIGTNEVTKTMKIN